MRFCIIMYINLERIIKMKPKVAIVLPYFGSGGAENMVSRIAAHLNLNKVEAEVICVYGQPQNNPLEQAVIENGIPIKFIGKGKGFSGDAIFKLWKELSAFEPSVVHTHLSTCVYCAPWVLMHKAKMLHTIHNTPRFELIKPKQKVMALMYKLNKAIPVAISHEIKSMIIQYYDLKSAPELIYNPVDVARFDIPKKIHEGIRVVTVGRISSQKNQKLLIDAVQNVTKTHSEVSLTILGDGPLRKEIEEYIQKENLENSVSLKGNVSNVEEYFAESDIFVLSSAYEGLPLVVLEAMAASLPIVSTDVGGVKDVVTDNGILVEPGNKDDLAQAILKLVENRQYSKKLGNKSFFYVQQYDSNKIANQYIELYQKYSHK